MNKHQAKIARMKIKTPGYNMRRWRKKIEQANIYNNLSIGCFGDRNSVTYYDCCHLEEMYRRQAAYYLKRK